MTTVDLNSDLGESFGVYTLGNDAEMLKIVSSANVACGFHAGDPLVMAATLEAAAANGVRVGAHPSVLDLWGFGRRSIVGERPADIEKHVIYQIGALQALAHAGGQRLQHVKTHGSLGNLAAEDLDLALAVARAVKAVDRDLILVVMPEMRTERAGEMVGLPMAREVYADRAYADTGNLLSRKIEGAVIHDADAAADRVVRMIEDREIVSISGRRMPVSIDTICVHGDTPGAVAMAGRIRQRLAEAGVGIAAFGA
ncbi:MAG TPA: 5-oxoprolinase subunit PxpA [Methylomirabilota bacterium]|nr:5-oxoprolinase subunit PxpA [Methylomirabilota bacterium]